MQFKTILAVVFVCLVFFASIGYTNSSGVKSKGPISRPDPFAKPHDRSNVRFPSQFKNGRRQFSGRSIIDTIKQRRQNKV
jgi:hypothetical protein